MYSWALSLLTSFPARKGEYLSPSQVSVLSRSLYKMKQYVNQILLVQHETNIPSHLNKLVTYLLLNKPASPSFPLLRLFLLFTVPLSAPSRKRTCIHAKFNQLEKILKLVDWFVNGSFSSIELNPTRMYLVPEVVGSPSCRTIAWDRSVSPTSGWTSICLLLMRWWNLAKKYTYRGDDDVVWIVRVAPGCCVIKSHHTRDNIQEILKYHTLTWYHHPQTHHSTTH